jgi:hypothetical protein
MEKAILKTLVYVNIFDYPLKGWEVHKWLIKTKADIKQVERKLSQMLTQGKIGYKNGFYYPLGSSKIVKLRQQRAVFSQQSLKKAIRASFLIRWIPFIELVGISGSLSMDNQQKTDDIDLFVITSANKLWTTRLLIVGILSIFGLVRRKNDQNFANKLCVNLLLDINHLEQQTKNIYIAHEVLQVRPIYIKSNAYSKFLNDNNWVFDYLPNWTSSIEYQKIKRAKNSKSTKFADFIEDLLRLYQIELMKGKLGDEKFDKHSIYFHPHDRSTEIESMIKKTLD